MVSWLSLYELMLIWLAYVMLSTILFNFPYVNSLHVVGEGNYIIVYY